LLRSRVSGGAEALAPSSPNLGARRVVDDPAAVALGSELRFGMNSGAPPAPTVRPGRRLPLAHSSCPASAPALSLS